RHKCCAARCKFDHVAWRTRRRHRTERRRQDGFVSLYSRTRKTGRERNLCWTFDDARILLAGTRETEFRQYDCGRSAPRETDARPRSLWAVRTFPVQRRRLQKENSQSVRRRKSARANGKVDAARREPFDARRTDESSRHSIRRSVGRSA